MATPTEQPGRGADILAHLYYAVGSANEVVMTSSAGDFAGTLRHPEGDGVVIACDTTRAPIRTGEPICVEYMGPADTYRFYAEVLSVAPERIVVSFPFAVECTTGRRLSERVVVPVLDGFAVRLGDMARPAVYPLFDLSVGGLAFIDAVDTGLKVGDLESGQLILPGEVPIQVGIEVRHLGLRRGQLVVGARICTVSLRDRLHLATFLVGLAKRTGLHGDAPVAGAPPSGPGVRQVIPPITSSTG